MGNAYEQCNGHQQENGLCDRCGNRLESLPRCYRLIPTPGYWATADGRSDDHNRAVIWDEGHKAAWDGRSSQENPYRREVLAHVIWGFTTGS